MNYLELALYAKWPVFVQNAFGNPTSRSPGYGKRVVTKLYVLWRSFCRQPGLLTCVHQKSQNLSPKKAEKAR